MAAEQRNIAVALESYRVHYGRLPTVREYYDGTRKAPVVIPENVPPIQYTLTSPVALIAALPGDPFSDPAREYHYYYYTDVTTCWMLGSVGPNRKPEFLSRHNGASANERRFVYGPPNASTSPLPGELRACDPKFFYPEGKGGSPLSTGLYDPTNGIVSKGDLIKTGP